MTEAELESMRNQLGKVGRPMEVWTVIYSRRIRPQASGVSGLRTAAGRVDEAF